MPDFATARRNMVTNQVQPNRVTDERLLEALEAVPRERFVPEPMRGVAYIDEDIPVAPGRYLMEPVVLARLLQAAAVRPGDVVLDVGCATGYSAAVLARLAGTVFGLESDAELATTAASLLSELNADNAAVITGPLRDGYAKQAPYDVIVFEGAVAELPKPITDQLVENGRLVAVIGGQRGMGAATLAQRVHGVLSRRVLFDAAVPPLPGFEVEPGFVF